jgi:Lrp/AsnC family leucine-responsive transcriptional regulator
MDSSVHVAAQKMLLQILQIQCCYRKIFCFEFLAVNSRIWIPWIKKILAALQANARASLQDIGAAVGLSASPCWARIKKMEEAGVIEGYTVRLNPQALGLADSVLVMVTLDSHSDNTLEKFGEVLATIPEVVEAHLVSGEYDYLLRIVVKDTRDYERLLREKLYKIKGIRHSQSSFVLRTLKKPTCLRGGCEGSDEADAEPGRRVSRLNAWRGAGRAAPVHGDAQQEHGHDHGAGLGIVEQRKLEVQQLAQPAGSHKAQNRRHADIHLPAVQRVGQQLRRSAGRVP